MGLSDLPPEVLNLVLSIPNTYLVISLWKCGDSRLNWSLANGGATSVYLECYNGPLKLRFPRMLTQLRFLRTLSINAPDRSLGNPTEIGLSLQRLSPRLEVLYLSCIEGQMPFLQPTELYLSELFEKGSLEPRERTWDIGSVFPNLHTLGIRGKETFYQADFDALPSTLTSLTLSLYGSHDDVVFPATLKSLTASIQPIQEIVKSLPPGLTTFDNGGTLIPPNLIKYLPRSLVKVVPYLQCDLTVENMKALPPDLTVLQLLVMQEPEAITLLPRNLTSLLFGRRLSQRVRKWTVEELRRLPRTLESMPIDQMIDWKSVTCEDWPSSLTTIDQAPVNMTPEQLAKLPPGLQTLMMHTTARWAEALTLRSETCISLLPPSLTKLGLTVSNMPTDKFITANAVRVYGAEAVAAISPQAPLRIPPLLFPPLPAHLHHLSLKQFNWDTCVDFLDAIPRTLQVLVMTDNTRPILPTAIQRLPKSITSLHLQFIGPNQTELAFLAHLPPSLLYLFVSTSSGGGAPPAANLTPEIVVGLPRGLTDMTFSRANVKVQPGALQHLPPHLQSLQLQGGHVHPDELANLPCASSLKVITLHILAPLEDRHMASLPRRLDRLDFRPAEQTYLAEWHLNSKSTYPDLPPLEPVRLAYRLTAEGLVDWPSRLSPQSVCLSSTCPAWTAWRNARMHERANLHNSPA